jgi:hypothetical protein
VYYRADASLLVPGSIVRLRNPLSSSGKPTGPHWFVILDAPAVLAAHAPELTGIGCTSTFRDDWFDARRHLRIPHAAKPNGHSMTGFTVPTLACVDWTHPIPVRIDGFQFDVEVDVDDDDARVLPVADLVKLKALFDSWEKSPKSPPDRKPRR